MPKKFTKMSLFTGYKKKTPLIYLEKCKCHPSVKTSMCL